MSQHHADTLFPDTDRAELDEALFGENAFCDPVEDLPVYPEPVPMPLPPAPAGCGTLDTVDMPTVSLPVGGYSYPETAQGVALQCGDTSYQLTDMAPGVFELRESVIEAVEAEEDPVACEEVSEEDPGSCDEAPEEAPAACEEMPEDNPVINYEVPEAIPAVNYEVPEPTIAPVLETLGELSVRVGERVAVTGKTLTLTGATPPGIDLMVLSPPAQGTLLREGFALTGGDLFTQDDIDQSRITYRHEGTEPGEDSFGVGTPCGTLTNLTVRVYIDPPPHQAPTLAGPGDLSAVQESCQVASLSPVGGIAIVGVSGRGEWLRRLPDVEEWTPLGDVQHGKALLLGPECCLRFVPRSRWAGIAKLTYRAWDGSSGCTGDSANLVTRLAVGGATAFSRETATATVSVHPAAEEELPIPPAPWEAHPTAHDLGGDGLAVVRLQGHGTWQFSLDNGRSWRDIGPVFHGRARVVRPGDKLRFVPRKGWSGRVGLAGRLWDGRDAVPGSSVSLSSRSAIGDDTPFGETVKSWTWELG